MPRMFDLSVVIARRVTMTLSAETAQEAQVRAIQLVEAGQADDQTGELLSTSVSSCVEADAPAPRREGGHAPPTRRPTTPPRRPERS